MNRKATVIILSVVLVAFCYSLIIAFVYSYESNHKVQQAIALFEAVGFKETEYLGLTDSEGGQYPTFRARSLSGAYADFYLRTVPGQGLEIQPVGSIVRVGSAYAFSAFAEGVVSDWYRIADDPTVSKEQFEGALEQYNMFEKHVFPETLKTEPWPDEAEGWP